MSKSASLSDDDEADTAVAALFDEESASAFLPSSPILAASDLEEIHCVINYIHSIDMLEIAKARLRDLASCLSAGWVSSHYQVFNFSCLFVYLLCMHYISMGVRM